MEDNKLQSSAPPWKRIVSFLVDLMLALIAGTVVFRNRDTSHWFLFISWINFAVLTSAALLITKKGTLGDSLIRIRIAALDGGLVLRSKLVLRNACICLFLAAVIVDPADSFATTLSALLFVGLSATIFIRSNRYHEPMGALDLAFKTIVVPSTSSKP